MGKQIRVFQTQTENNAQINEQNRFQDCEAIVDELIEKGLPSSFVPENFISKIAENYGISYQEAKTCLKLATRQLELDKSQEYQKPQEKLYAQSGYFYPQGYSDIQKTSKHKDGMESLSSLSSYNRLMFGLR